MFQKIVIIGGGVLGACSSYYLAEAGHEVIVLERRELASGASGGNSGETSLLDRGDPWHLETSLASLKIYEQWSRTHDIEYQVTGGCTVLHDEEQYFAMREIARELVPYGVPVEFYVGERMREIEPLINVERLHSLACCPMEGKINPFYTTLSFFEEAKKLGVKIHAHTEVTGFEIEDRTISAVHTDRGDFTGDIVVNAAGAWASRIGELCGVPVPVLNHRGTAFVTEPVQPCINTPVVDGDYLIKKLMNSEKRSICIGANQCKHGGIVIAQATEVTDLEDKEVSVQGLCQTAKLFTEYFPSLSDVAVVRAWSAVTPFTKDGLPVFGFSEGLKNLFTVAGFKGAFTTAPVVGQNVVRALDEGFVWEGGRFSPDRAL
ncbi:MAG: FAD-dependent oxidoreductase [Bacillota bacterium]